MLPQYYYSSMDPFAQCAPSPKEKAIVLSADGRALYNPFSADTPKAAEYDRWCVLMDAKQFDEADAVFLKQNGMTFKEREGVESWEWMK